MKIFDYNGNKNLCGDKVRQSRQALKLTQSELAVKLQLENISIEQKSLSRLEIGQRFVSDFELKALAKVLNVNVDWLIS